MNFFYRKKKTNKINKKKKRERNQITSSTLSTSFSTFSRAADVGCGPLESNGSWTSTECAWPILADNGRRNPHWIIPHNEQNPTAGATDSRRIHFIAFHCISLRYIQSVTQPETQFPHRPMRDAAGCRPPISARRKPIFNNSATKSRQIRQFFPTGMEICKPIANQLMGNVKNVELCW